MYISYARGVSLNFISVSWLSYIFDCEVIVFVNIDNTLLSLLHIFIRLLFTFSFHLLLLQAIHFFLGFSCFPFATSFAFAIAFNPIFTLLACVSFVCLSTRLSASLFALAMAILSFLELFETVFQSL